MGAVENFQRKLFISLIYSSSTQPHSGLDRSRNPARPSFDIFCFFPESYPLLKTKTSNLHSRCTQKPECTRTAALTSVTPENWRFVSGSPPLGVSPKTAIAAIVEARLDQRYLPGMPAGPGGVRHARSGPRALGRQSRRRSVRLCTNFADPEFSTFSTQSAKCCRS
jgi:hypothetical protein